MKHQGTVRIETERLVLRRFVPEDAPSAFRNWTSDVRVTEFLRWPVHESVEATEEILGRWIADYEKKDVYQWVIELKALGEPIGTISVVKQDEQVDMVHLGYCIGSKWWHRGITSEALAAVLPFLFYQVGANRVEAWHDPENANSGAVMRKCGMKYEGTLRQADFSNRGIVDAAVYGLLAEEFESATEGTT